MDGLGIGLILILGAVFILVLKLAHNKPNAESLLTKCPFCSEHIKYEAIFCKNCKQPVYFK